ncbi:acetyl-CoA carboxylase biotin carboxylase subunit [Clostridia bacterium OttesenSCG-928-F22]|nr:acetyl-CoA carboxylase biotin carboxylase subunit [Clostridia bacterium OttesenSCG-928-F22]
MINKVLVANRGEIAVRIIRACRELGLETVAIYSEADQYACHVQLADEAVCIGPASAYESYLNPYNVLSAAQVTKADALHPGYGFLSENPKFVGMCQKSNITFIGPDMDTMAKVGNKLQARRIASEAGVPVIPGTLEALKNALEAAKAAEKLGYPVMLKSVAGGGGKGIRRVERKSDMHKAFTDAQTEAFATFGDGSLYMEKVIENARHIEVQVLFDHYGTGVHLFERECSLQRRNQKVVEEAPCIFLNDAQRKRVCFLAMKAARAADYKNAGTVEFLVDEDHHFYFMEINARIQVEHPVTEMVTGVDIIKQQIHIAAGERLQLDQRNIRLNGHAIECRINAEDITRNFMPSSGKVELMHIPGGKDIRFDTALYMNCSIPANYDPMVGKLIVCDNTRSEALAKMRSALSELVIQGVETNIDFQIDLLTNKQIISGELDTGLLDRIMEE